jgi:hypothetical protein
MPYQDKGYRVHGHIKGKTFEIIQESLSKTNATPNKQDKNTKQQNGG